MTAAAVQASADPAERETTATQRSLRRRLQFRDAVARLSTKAKSTDLLRWIVLPGAIGVVLGLVFIFLGWVGASRTVREIEQIPYLISGGLIGLALVFIGALLLASAFWLAVTKKLQEETAAQFRDYTAELERRLVELEVDVHDVRENGRAPRQRSAARSRQLRASKS